MTGKKGAEQALERCSASLSPRGSQTRTWHCHTPPQWLTPDREVWTDPQGARRQSSHTAGAANWGGHCASMKPAGDILCEPACHMPDRKEAMDPRPSQRITTHPAFARGTKPLGHTTCYLPTSLTESPSSYVQDGMQGDQQPLQPRTT